MNTPLDYSDIKALAKERGRPVKELLALAPQNDPFYAGAPARKKSAEWFAELWHRIELKPGVHLRRIHYRLISQSSPVLMANGLPYENTEACWAEIGTASKAARYLSLVPLEAFVDRRNDEPTIYLAGGSTGYLSAGFTVPYMGENIAGEMPYLPALYVTAPMIEQRYHIEIWAEKTTVNDVLLPLPERYGLNIVTGSGELSVTACTMLMNRAIESQRPVRILYISDFDPAGMSMPLAVARKIEFFHRGHGLDLDLQVRPVVLTAEQCREFSLPRTPIKESEKRAAAFEARFGGGATELDALEALYPGVLRNILRAEIERYYDVTLRSRTAAVAREINRKLAVINSEVHAEHEASIEALRVEWQAIQNSIEEWKERAQDVWLAITRALEARAPKFNSIAWPEAAEGREDPEPLFDSRRSYLEQMEVYKRHQGHLAGLSQADEDPSSCPPAKQHILVGGPVGSSTLSKRWREIQNWRIETFDLRLSFYKGPTSSPASRRRSRTKTSRRSCTAGEHPSPVHGSASATPGTATSPVARERRDARTPQPSIVGKTEDVLRSRMRSWISAFWMPKLRRKLYRDRHRKLYRNPYRNLLGSPCGFLYMSLHRRVPSVQNPAQ